MVWVEVNFAKLLYLYRPWRQGADAAQGIYRPKKGGDNDIYGDDLDNIIKTNKYVHDLIRLMRNGYY